MSLKITTEPRENRQFQLTIEVDQPRVDQQLKKAARKLARDYRIPGFRKGKAPYDIIVQYLGEHTLYNEIIDELGQEVYVEALAEESLEPYAQASLEDVSFDPLTYKLLVPMEPVVELGDHRALRVEEDEPTVDEEAVTERLESYREQYAGWQDVTRPSQYGDMLNIDVKSVIAVPEGEEGDEIVVLDESDWDVTPDEENPMEPAGFDEALLGMTPGEEKSFDLNWPDDSQSIYAGKTAHFQVKLNSIQAYEKPELNDEFAQLVGPDFETLDALLANIRETLSEQAQQEAENAYLDKVLTALLEQSTLDYPPAVVEDQLNSMINDFEQRLRQFGIGDIDTYFEQVGQDRDAYRESLREQAVNIAERNLLISELWKAEKIKVDDSDIEEKITEVLGELPANDDENASSEGLSQMLRSGAGRSIFEAQILQEKTIARLLDIVRGNDVPDLSELEEADEAAPVADETDATDATDAESAAEDAAEDVTEA